MDATELLKELETLDALIEKDPDEARDALAHLQDRIRDEGVHQ